MASSWKKLSKIDKKTKYSVYGWIRQVEQELRLSHIPLMVSSICILYYVEDEIFNQISDTVKISKNGKCITKSKGTDSSWGNTNYGAIKIASNSQDVYRWEMKFTSTNSLEIIIGITNTTDPNKRFNNSINQIGYALCQDGDVYDGKEWHIEHYRPTHNKIRMELDLKNGKLSFFGDDSEYGIVIQNIQNSEDITYRMFVSMYNENEAVEIINFSKQ